MASGAKSIRAVSQAICARSEKLQDHAKLLIELEQQSTRERNIFRLSSKSTIESLDSEYGSLRDELRTLRSKNSTDSDKSTKLAAAISKKKELISELLRNESEISDQVNGVGLEPLSKRLQEALEESDHLIIQVRESESQNQAIDAQIRDLEASTALLDGQLNVLETNANTILEIKHRFSHVHDLESDLVRVKPHLHDAKLKVRAVQCEVGRKIAEMNHVIRVKSEVLKDIESSEHFQETCTRARKFQYELTSLPEIREELAQEISKTNAEREVLNKDEQQIRALLNEVISELAAVPTFESTPLIQCDPIDYDALKREFQDLKARLHEAVIEDASIQITEREHKDLIDSDDIYRAKKEMIDRHDFLLEEIMTTRREVQQLHRAIEETHWRLNVDEAETLRLSDLETSKSEVSNDVFEQFEKTQTDGIFRKRNLSIQIRGLKHRITDKTQSIETRSSRVSRKTASNEAWVGKSESGIANGSPRIGDSLSSTIAQYFADLTTMFAEEGESWRAGRADFERASLKSWLAQIDTAGEKIGKWTQG
jgi:hypothetical protein